MNLTLSKYKEMEQKLPFLVHLQNVAPLKHQFIQMFQIVLHYDIKAAKVGDQIMQMFG